MRDREEIEREIRERREDLGENLQQLKDAVRDKVEEVKDKVNVPKRAREAVVAGKDRALEAAREVRDAARARPLPFIGVAAGVLLAGGLIVLAVRRARRRSDNAAR